MIITGIDPGSRILGYGTIEVVGQHCKALDYGCIKLPEKMEEADRYCAILCQVEKLILNQRCQALSIETQYLKHNVKSTMTLSIVRGIIMAIGKKCGLDVFLYTPSIAKKAAVGKGDASKQQVQEMIKMLLNLKTIPEPNDAADALALALCHAHSLSSRTFI